MINPIYKVVIASKVIISGILAFSLRSRTLWNIGKPLTKLLVEKSFSITLLYDQNIVEHIFCSLILLTGKFR